MTAVEIHERNSNNNPILPSLLDTTARNFNVVELSADKQYAGEKNFSGNREAQRNALHRVSLRYNRTVRWFVREGVHYFALNRDEFLAHYHKRSNVESTVMMVKTKFGDCVRSKTDVAMRNEVQCKFLCHNVCCLISAFYELGIQPLFRACPADAKSNSYQQIERDSDLSS